MIVVAVLIALLGAGFTVAIGWHLCEAKLRIPGTHNPDSPWWITEEVISAVATTIVAWSLFAVVVFLLLT